MSEWGNLSSDGRSSNGKQTQGTETSKYLEEEKTIVIAPVVASESARAQTCLVKARQGL